MFLEAAIVKVQRHTGSVETQQGLQWSHVENQTRQEWIRQFSCNINPIWDMTETSSLQPLAFTSFVKEM